MKRSILITLFIIIIYAPNGAFSQDKFITYNSDDEKYYLNNLLDYKSLFKLTLLAKTDLPTAEKHLAQVDSFIAQIEWSPSDNKKPTKKLKQLFKNIHNSFLKTYDDEVSVDEMFKTGKYHCVSASILYAYIFQSLAIPFEIKEEPTHVYVVAYPDEFNILIETTDPSTGIFVPNIKAKTNYINELVKHKYVDQQYVNQVGIEKAFNEFFFGKTNITFQELIALDFYNKSIAYLGEESLERAYSEIYKAAKLYPAKKHEFIKQLTMEQLAIKLPLDKMEDWEFLTKTLESSQNEFIKKIVPMEFNTATEKYLIKSNKKNLLDSIYTYLVNEVADTSILNSVTYSYYNQLAYAYFSNGNHLEADKNLEILYNRNNADLRVKNLIKDNTFKMAKMTGGIENNNLLEELSKKYTFFDTDKDIQSFYIYNLMLETHSYYNSDNRKDGIVYFEKLIQKLKSSPNSLSNVNQNMIEDLFTQTAGYYVMHNNKEKARAIIKSGLEIFPSNKKLKYTITQIN